MKVLFAFLIALVALAGIALAPGLVMAAPDAAKINVDLNDFTVGMSAQTIPANTAVTFTFINRGTLVHEVVLEKKGVVDEPLGIGGDEAEVEDIKPGETRTITWTISETGEYQLACHIEGHFEHGMLQTFSVVPPTSDGDSGVPLGLIAAGVAGVLLLGGGFFIFSRNRKTGALA
jgi:uncharacterized cupredoxin-like copper-binding protein